MNLRVDHPGHQVQSRAVNVELVIQRFQGFAKRDALDEATTDSQVANACFIGEDHRCALNEDVAVHVALSYLGAVFST